MALKLLHTADWHLGRRFPRFPADQEQRLTRARLDVVSRILDLGQSRDVDAILCAGDIFDQAAPDEIWWKGLAEEFNRRNWQRPVFLLPGNHDPLTPRSPWDPSHPFRAALPNYVRVVDTDDFTHEFGDTAVLHAVPCRSHAGQADPTQKIPTRAAGDTRIRIGLVHGQTFDMAGHQTNFPIAEDSTDRCGLDYLALGDTHSFREVWPGARAPTVYPGTPEATTFGEPGSGSVALVFFPRDRARPAMVERQHVATWTWRDETCRSLIELRQLALDESLRTCVLRLTITMEVALAEYDEVEQILTQLAGSLSRSQLVGVLEIERSGLSLSGAGREDFPDDLPPVLGAAVDRLRQHAATDPETSARALHHLYRLVRGGNSA